MRIVVLGMMGQSPFGGQTWMHLHWLLGFHRLGHEVWYVEDSAAWPFDPVENTLTENPRYAVRHIADAMARVGLPDRWAYRLAHRPQETWGRSATELRELYRTCDLLINLTGGTILTDEHRAAPCRVYLETDPVTVELKIASGDTFAREMLAAHNVHVTYGENYGAADCGVPLAGIAWRKTRQPIALDWWPMVFTPDAPYFTTIGNYRQSGQDVTWNGTTYYWSKHHEWEKFLALPQRTRQRFELALMVKDEADRQKLEAHGWRIVSPWEMSLDVFGAYPRYVQQSRAEFTVAKDQNVRLRSGWFSERDVCYLASGKPVVAQDTGFGAVVPTGRGLFAFRAPEDALTAIEQINADYAGQCRAARAVAEESFACEKVAAAFLADLPAEARV